MSILIYCCMRKIGRCTARLEANHAKPKIGSHPLFEELVREDFHLFQEDDILFGSRSFPQSLWRKNAKCLHQSSLSQTKNWDPAHFSQPSHHSQWKMFPKTWIPQSPNQDIPEVFDDNSEISCLKMSRKLAPAAPCEWRQAILPDSQQSLFSRPDPVFQQSESQLSES